VNGYWIESENTEGEKRVIEDSIFVNTNIPSKYTQLVDLAHKLANKHDQDSILVKTPKETKLINKDGSEEVKNGKLQAGELGDFYTKLRHKNKTSTFIFESERLDGSNMTRFSEYVKQQNQKAKQ